MKKKIFLFLSLFIGLIHALMAENFNDFLFQVNKATLNDVISFLQKKHLVYTEKKQYIKIFDLYLKFINIKFEKNIKNNNIFLIQYFFDKKGILKSETFYLKNNSLKFHLNSLKIKYPDMVIQKNINDYLELVISFKESNNIIGILEKIKGKDFFTIRFIDKDFLENFLSSFQNLILKLYYSQSHQ